MMGQRAMEAAAALALAWVLLAGCNSEPAFQGTVIEPPIQATPFELTDQFGETVSLASLSGKIVALTFLYTYCPDICPLTAEALRKAHASLGQQASEVAFVVITVDPARDTPQRAYEYSEQKGMLDKWLFLTGSVEELSPVWQGYFVVAEAHRTNQDGAFERLSQATLAQEAQQENLSPYLVSHQAPVYLIDRGGQIRVLHSDVTLDVEPLTRDLELLLR